MNDSKKDNNKDSKNLNHDSDRPVQEPLPELVAYRHTLLGQFDQRFLSGGAARLVAAIILVVALAGPSIQFTHKIQETQSSIVRGERHRTALGRWLPTAQLLVTPDNTTDPYSYGHWFPTPPMVLISIAPLSKLGYQGAAIVWSLLKMAGFLIAVSLLIRGLGRREFAVPLGVLLITLLYSVRPVIGDITHGNLNLFMMIWIALGWALYVRGQDFWAGVLMALAVVTKITPALAVVYFIYKREWRVVLGALVGLLGVFIVVPGLLIGFRENVEYLSSWFQMLVVPALDGYVTYAIQNQSLSGVVTRLMYNAGILKVEMMGADEAMVAGMDDPMLRPLTTWGRLLRPALVLPILGTLAWFCRLRGVSRRDPRLLLELGLVLLAMLLLSERTWKHHATTLPIVFLGVWYALTCINLTDKFRAWFVAGLAVQLALLVGTTQGLLPDRLADRLLDGGFFCWGLVLCFGQIAWLLAALKKASGTPGSSLAAPGG